MRPRISWNTHKGGGCKSVGCVRGCRETGKTESGVSFNSPFSIYSRSPVVTLAGSPIATARTSHGTGAGGRRGHGTEFTALPEGRGVGHRRGRLKSRHVEPGTARCCGRARVRACVCDENHFEKLVSTVGPVTASTLGVDGVIQRQYGLWGTGAVVRNIPRIRERI